MLRHIKGIIGMLRGSKQDDFEIRISRNKLDSLLTSYDERVAIATELSRNLRIDYNEFRSDMITRMKSLEGKYGDARKALVELNAINEELKAENEALASDIQQKENPPDSEEALAAKELVSWGYTEDQLPKILQLAKENEQLLRSAKEDDDESLIETMRSNKFLIQIALKNKGILTKAERGGAQEQQMGAVY